MGRCLLVTARNVRADEKGPRRFTVFGTLDELGGTLQIIPPSGAVELFLFEQGGSFFEGGQGLVVLSGFLTQLSPQTPEKMILGIFLQEGIDHGTRFLELTCAKGY